jgi:hypothetical protein
MAVLLALATACGGDEEGPVDSAPASSTPSPSTEADSPSATPTPDLTNAQIEKHLADVFSQEPRKISRAMQMTASGSVAESYATYRLAVANSNLDGGYPQSAWDVSMGSDEAQACPPDDGECADIADFLLDNGKLAAFTVDGKGLDKRLVMGSKKAMPVAGAGTVQFLVAYRTISDDALIVAVRLRAGADGLSILDSYYRARNGRQSASENISGPPDLGPDSSATYTMAFPAAQPGGTATLRVYVNNGPPVPVSVQVR